MYFFSRVTGLTAVMIVMSTAPSLSAGNLNIENLKARRSVTRVEKDLSSDDELPESVNWVDKGYVTPVKFQKECNSGWAFSAVGAVEGQHFKDSRNLISLSAQQVVDCSKETDKGCKGGNPQGALKYIIFASGIEAEATYPYTGKDDVTCHFNKTRVAATVAVYTQVGTDEKALKVAVATIGPISVMIDANHTSFINYKAGVYFEKECSSSKLTHGVLVVGYGTTLTGEDYWLVKNSYGILWGELGYIRMARNKENNCGIATAAHYPKVHVGSDSLDLTGLH